MIAPVVIFMAAAGIIVLFLVVSWIVSLTAGAASLVAGGKQEIQTSTEVVTETPKETAKVAVKRKPVLKYFVDLGALGLQEIQKNEIKSMEKQNYKVITKEV